MKEIKFVLSHLAAILWVSSWFLGYILPTENGRITFGIISFFSTIGLMILGMKYLMDHWNEDKE